MVVSLVLGFLAMFVATMGMKCTSCGGDDKVKKARIAMTGGIVFIVAGELQAQGGPRRSVEASKVPAPGLPTCQSLSPPGLAALVACSWYGHQIVTDFYNPLVPMNLK